MAYNKVKLSGSTDGMGIKVAATSTAGTTIHTAVAGTSTLDEIWLYASNNGTDAKKLTIEYGGANVEDNIEQTIPGESGLFLVLPGLLLQNEKVVKAFAATADVITIHGYVNRITA